MASGNKPDPCLSDPRPGVGDYVRFNQGFPLLGIHEGDHATVIGVAHWGEWMLLCGETDHPMVRQFPATVFEVAESAALRHREEP